MSSQRSLILNQAQAEAVYTAMCHLNNVCGQIQVRFPVEGGLKIDVYETRFGAIHVESEYSGAGSQGNPWTENYADQSAFAAAYGLQQG